MRAKEIEDLLSSVPDPTADESNFSLHMRKKGSTPEDFVAVKTKLDNGIHDFNKLFKSLELPQEEPCPYAEALDKFKEVSEYTNDVVVTSVLLCYIRNAMCRKPGGQDVRKNLAVVLASIKDRDQTAVPVKFQEEAKFMLNSFGDSKPPKDSKPSSCGLGEADTEPSPPTGTAKRPRSSAAAGRGKAAKAVAKAKLTPS